MHQAEVVIWVIDHILKVVNWIGRNQCLSYHEFYCLACLMQVDLFEKFKARLVDEVDIVMHLDIVGKLALNDLCIVNDASVLELLCVDGRVRQVTIQVVELVKVERVALVGHYVEQKSLRGAMPGISLTLTLD